VRLRKIQQFSPLQQPFPETGRIAESQTLSAKI
jgi:hypothetical protein